MKRFTLALSLWCAGVACQVAPPRAQESGYAVRVMSEDLPRLCMLDSGPANPHESEVRATLLALLADKEIPSAVILPKLVSLPIYENDGRLVRRKFLEQIAKAMDACDLVHLSWNIPHAENTIEIERALEKLGREKAVLVAAAGGPATGLRAPLSSTVLGYVTTALIVGEKGPEGLITPAFSGPEMLTALNAPSGTKGSSFSSLVLTAEIAARWKMRKPDEWLVWSKDLREGLALANKSPESGAVLYRNAPELVGR